jgi:hypothetical protein
MQSRGNSQFASLSISALVTFRTGEGLGEGVFANRMSRSELRIAKLRVLNTPFAACGYHLPPVSVLLRFGDGFGKGSRALRILRFRNLTGRASISMQAKKAQSRLRAHRLPSTSDRNRSLSDDHGMALSSIADRRVQGNNVVALREGTWRNRYVPTTNERWRRRTGRSFDNTDSRETGFDAHRGSPISHDREARHYWR